MIKRLIISLLIFIPLVSFSQNVNNSDELIPFPDSRTGKVGYGNAKLGVVIKPQFTSGGYDINGYYVVSKGKALEPDEKFAVIDRAGNYYINFKEGYEFIALGNEENKDLIMVKKKGKYGYIDYNKVVVIPLIYDNLGDFHAGLAYAEQGGKYGFINKKGEAAIDFAYQGAGDFRTLKAGEYYARVETNDKYGCINIKGEFIIPCEYDFIETSQVNTIAATKGDEIYHFDINGKLEKKEKAQNNIK